MTANITAHAELRDEALRKIGRNIVNLQRMERALKSLIVRSNIEGFASELAEAYVKKSATTERRSLGLLVQEFIDSMHVTGTRPTESHDQLTQPWLSTSFAIESDEATIEERRAALSRIVEDRNNLVHKVLARFDPDSAESCQSLIATLDEQNERLEPHYRFVAGVLSQLHSLQKELLTHMEATLSQPPVGDTDAV
jgi:hypothetical protein